MSWAGTFGVQGIVRASDTGEPVDRVLVELTGSGRRVLWDTLGRCEIDGMTEGVHSLRFSRLGYETRLVEVIVGADSVMQMDVRMRPDPLPLPPATVQAPHVITRSEVDNDTVLYRQVGSRTMSGD